MMIGRTVGNWRLLRLIGEGAFGAVYEGENVHVRARRAAVKVLHPTVSLQESMRQRFLNEAAASSRVEHEHIVQIFDAGVSEEGISYVAMELLRGMTLAGALEAGPLSIERTVAIISEVASALAAAHEAGIVHRDIKPDNIFLAQRAGRADYVKVLDFGIAKLYDNGDGTVLTRPGMVLGTPGYVAPEQWKSVPDIDGRADVYALGVVLFQCVTGCLPFNARTSFEWLEAHLTHAPPDLRRVAHAPSGLATLVARMLAKAREDRPQRMEDVVRALAAPLDYDVSNSQAPTRQIPLSALPGASAEADGEAVWSMPRRRAPAFAVAGFAVALALAGFGFWRSTSPPGESKPAVAVRKPVSIPVPVEKSVVAAADDHVAASAPTPAAAPPSVVIDAAMLALPRAAPDPPAGGKPAESPPPPVKRPPAPPVRPGPREPIREPRAPRVEHDKRGAPADDDVDDAESLFDAAQQDYVIGNYGSARDKALRSIAFRPSSAAWRIVGLASCRLAEAETARNAWEKLGPADRASLERMCARSGIAVDR